MNAETRVLFRVVVCVAFVASLYGGMILLTAAMFAKGFIIVGILSGLVLSGMTAMALALFGLAWSMTRPRPEEERLWLASQPG